MWCSHHNSGLVHRCSIIDDDNDDVYLRPVVEPLLRRIHFDNIVADIDVRAGPRVGLTASCRFVISEDDDNVGNMGSVRGPVAACRFMLEDDPGFRGLPGCNGLLIARSTVGLALSSAEPELVGLPGERVLHHGASSGLSTDSPSLTARLQTSTRTLQCGLPQTQIVGSSAPIIPLSSIVRRRQSRLSGIERIKADPFEGLTAIAARTLRAWVEATGIETIRSQRFRRYAAAIRLVDTVLQYGWPSIDIRLGVGLSRELAIIGLAKMGKGASASLISDTRNSLERFAAFVGKDDDGQVPVTADNVVRFLSEVSSNRACSAPSADKGTAARKLFSSLKRAGELLAAPFTSAIMNSPGVRAAARGTVPLRPPSEYNVSVMLIMLIECVAIGPHLWQTIFRGAYPWSMSTGAVNRAREIIIRTFSSLRGASMDNVVIGDFVTPLSAGPQLGGFGYLILRSLDKTANDATKEHWMLARGLIRGGIESWLPLWAEAHRGKNYFTPALLGSADIWEASGVSVITPAPKDAITSALRQFASAAPIFQSASASRTIGLSMRGLRHFVTSIQVALGVRDVDPAFSSGDWDPGVQKAAGKRSRDVHSMPLRYAGGELRLLARAQTMLTLFDRFERFLVSPEEWRVKIPLQSGEHPSFRFLMPAFISEAMPPSVSEALVPAYVLSPLARTRPTSPTMTICTRSRKQVRQRQPPTQRQPQRLLPFDQQAL